MDKKTDNHNPKAKLDLRRYFLRKYHADGPIHVMDCCQGSGVLWNTLREEFAVDSYWGLDLKPKKGRLKIDSTRILAQPGWMQNVIDIDTYGSPWKHWAAMLPNIVRPTTVFLTWGSHSLEVLGSLERQAIGLNLRAVIPTAFWPKLQLLGFSVPYLLTTGLVNITIADALQAESEGTARYLGIRLEPQKTSDREAVTSGRSEPKQPVKEVAHV